MGSKDGGGGGGGMAAQAGRLGVVASVAFNLAALAFYLRRRYFGGDDAAAVRKKAEAEVAPSSGKPPVTKDSIINLDHLCWFLEPGLEREVRRLHRLVGNAVADGYHVLVGTGSTQLFQAALYALSPPGPSAPMNVVSPAPYYSSYPAVTDFLKSGLYRWAGDAKMFDGDTYVELVCSPSNPDGGIREAVLKSGDGVAVHDLAYYWPQYTPITSAAAHDIMLFTVSKCTGHAGTRLGWRCEDRAILKAITDGYDRAPAAGDDDDDSSRLFHFARRKMVSRWAKLRAAVAASGIFTLPDELPGHCTFANETVSAYPPFAWLRCGKEGVDDLEGYLRERKIISRGGGKFGADGRVVRISMLDTDEAFAIFVDRLAAMN
ncbi:hypothetical protein OsJ_17275 [Oryza sativa Japonica Group]|uniref:Alliinase C-terminal domain-containing protein n=1 Tax=Oryza sativa subsp. japonica TaxID=39947 RepID=B9FMP4_ORYSJ|nr:hypothetical protein OsJ_17275 [Oryza sativa Japonica Group]